jgi:hypothetical protein
MTLLRILVLRSGFGLTPAVDGVALGFDSAGIRGAPSSGPVLSGRFAKHLWPRPPCRGFFIGLRRVAIRFNNSERNTRIFSSIDAVPLDDCMTVIVEDGPYEGPAPAPR